MKAHIHGDDHSRATVASSLVPQSLDVHSESRHLSNSAAVTAAGSQQSAAGMTVDSRLARRVTVDGQPVSRT